MNEDEDKVKVLEFVLFCVEMYAQKHEISGRVVMDRFSEYGVVDFLRDGYDVLHTQGREWLIADMEDYLKVRGIAA